MNVALKNVAVTAFAAQTLEGETWQGMCRYAVDAISNGKNPKQMRDEMKEVERQMKADYDVTAMPSAWRSAKSVVLAAVWYDVPLMSGVNVHGKTDIETRIKAARIARGRGKVGEALTTYLRVAKQAEALWSAMSTDEQDRVPIHLKWVTE